MKSVLRVTRTEWTVKKSRFIGYIYPVAFIKDVEHTLTSLKKSYPDASHHCFAYILGDAQEVQRFDDDGEPSQTAGLPMLEVLKKQNLTNVLAVVIRYYGGVKLGAGGLVRAYTKSVSETLKKAVLATKNARLSIEIVTTFKASGAIENLLSSHGIITERIYREYVLFQAEIPKEKQALIERHVQDITSGDSMVKIVREFNTYR